MLRAASLIRKVEIPVILEDGGRGGKSERKKRWKEGEQAMQGEIAELRRRLDTVEQLSREKGKSSAEGKLQTFQKSIVTSTATTDRPKIVQIPGVSWRVQTDSSERRTSLIAGEVEPCDLDLGGEDDEEMDIVQPESVSPDPPSAPAFPIASSSTATTVPRDGGELNRDEVERRVPEQVEAVDDSSAGMDIDEEQLEDDEAVAAPDSTEDVEILRAAYNLRRRTGGKVVVDQSSEEDTETDEGDDEDSSEVGSKKGEEGSDSTSGSDEEDDSDVEDEGPPVKANPPKSGETKRRRPYNLRQRGSGTKRYQCGECGAVLASQKSLRRHEREIHEEPVRGTFSCNVCKKQYSSSTYLRQHLKTHTVDQSYKCETCGKSMGNRQSFKVHRETHNPDRTKDFKCPTCSKMFFTSLELKSHMMIHRKKTFKCPQCPMRFKIKSEVGKHLISHSRRKPFRCEFCPGRFKRSSELVTHLRIHTRERPYHCEICPMEFRRSDHLENHRRHVHAEDRVEKEKPFRCPVCGAGFTRNYSMEKHRRTQH